MEKIISTFKLQTNLLKVKISIPFIELLRKKEYRDKITGMVRNQGEFQPDIFEVNDDDPTIVFVAKIENGDEDGFPPFYLSPNVHDMVVHNAMLDYGTSNNMMPKGVVQSLGLEVTRPYKDLYSFYLRKV